MRWLFKLVGVGPLMGWIITGLAASFVALLVYANYQSGQAAKWYEKYQVTSAVLTNQTNTINATLQRLTDQEARGVEAIERLEKFTSEQEVKAMENDLAAEAAEQQDLKNGINKTFDSRFIH